MKTFLQNQKLQYLEIQKFKFYCHKTGEIGYNL